MCILNTNQTGDCINFNMEYPDCDAEEPWRVGDNKCDEEYLTFGCKFDNLDCCKISDLSAPTEQALLDAGFFIASRTIRSILNSESEVMENKFTAVVLNWINMIFSCRLLC